MLKQVNDFDVVVSLPNHLTGFVSLDQVSENFAKQFEAAAASEDSEKLVRAPFFAMAYACLESTAAE